MDYMDQTVPSPADAGAVAVEVFLADDGVDGEHPSYGPGIFFTRNCMKVVYISQPMTPEQIWKLAALNSNSTADWIDPVAFARGIEQHHRIKEFK